MHNSYAFRMRLEKLRQVDLNLLIIFAVIAEAEQSGHPKRPPDLLLSQPAVSCALQRARSTMFQDELVVRSPFRV